jgi:hypothetical protein
MYLLVALVLVAGEIRRTDAPIAVWVNVNPSRIVAGGVAIGTMNVCNDGDGPQRLSSAIFIHDYCQVSSIDGASVPCTWRDDGVRSHSMRDEMPGTCRQDEAPITEACFLLEGQYIFQCVYRWYPAPRGIGQVRIGARVDFTVDPPSSEGDKAAFLAAEPYLVPGSVTGSLEDPPYSGALLVARRFPDSPSTELLLGTVLVRFGGLLTHGWFIQEPSAELALAFSTATHEGFLFERDSDVVEAAAMHIVERFSGSIYANKAVLALRRIENIRESFAMEDNRRFIANRAAVATADAGIRTRRAKIIVGITLMIVIVSASLWVFGQRFRNARKSI